MLPNQSAVKDGWGRALAERVKEVNYEENARKKFFSWLVKLFFFSLSSRGFFQHRERDVNASKERTELREKNHRSRLSSAENASGCNRSSCGVEICGSHEASSVFCEWKGEKLLYPDSISRERRNGADSRKTRILLVELVKCFIFYFITYFQQRLHLTQKEGNNKAINTKEIIRKTYLSAGAVRGFRHKGNSYFLS